MEKHVRGQRIADSLMRKPIYSESGNEDYDFDSPDIEKLRDLDLSEKSEYIDQLKADQELKKMKLSLFEQQQKQIPPTPDGQSAGVGGSGADKSKSQRTHTHTQRKGNSTDKRREDDNRRAEDDRSDPGE